MLAAVGAFFLCNLLSYLAGFIFEALFLSAFSLVYPSHFAHYALRSAVMAGAFPLLCYLISYRTSRRFAEDCENGGASEYQKKQLKYLAVPLATYEVLLMLLPDIADIAFAPATFFSEYLPKFILRRDLLSARIVGAAAYIAYVLLSHKIAASTALGAWRKNGGRAKIKLNGRAILRLSGVILQTAFAVYLAAALVLKDKSDGRAWLVMLYCLLFAAASELLYVFDAVWSLCSDRSPLNIAKTAAAAACPILLCLAYAGRVRAALCFAAVGIQLLLELFAFTKDKFLIRSGRMLEKKDIHEFLASNGIKSSDTVLVHTSFRSLGEVEGGCDGFIDAMCEYLSDGLFLVPTHTWANVTAESPTFDVRSTEPCIGALPRTAAKREDGVRSLHPTHSLAAFGARAREFVRGEENARTPCPVGGAWSRLYDERAKILLIGVGLNRNTYIHAIDEMIDLPDRLADPVTLHVIGYEGEEYTFEFRKHGENTGSENFGVFESALADGGALTHARLGEATVGIFDAVRGTEIIKELWANAECDLTRDVEKITK